MLPDGFTANYFGEPNNWEWVEIRNKFGQISVEITEIYYQDDNIRYRSFHGGPKFGDESFDLKDPDLTKKLKQHIQDTIATYEWTG